MVDYLGFTTRQAAAVAGVERHVLLTSIQRNGHWLGVKPAKLPNRRLIWPKLAVYQALGKLPGTPSRDPATKLRQAVCATVPGLDPFQAQQFSEALFADDPAGATVAERSASALRSLSSLVELIEAEAQRVRALMHDEGKLSADTLRQLNHAAEDLTTATANLSMPLRWRQPAPPACVGMLDISKRRDVGVSQ